jgi:ABC-type uncharacterized transport system fused permease/ATPase subunit
MISSNSQDSDDILLKFENVTVLIPDRTRVVIGAIPHVVESSHGKHIEYRGIDVSIKMGDRVLIAGPSGCGKRLVTHCE